MNLATGSIPDAKVHTMASHNQTTLGTALAATLDETSDVVEDNLVDSIVVEEAVEVSDEIIPETAIETPTVLPIQESAETVETLNEASVETLESPDEVIDETPIVAPVQVPVKIPVKSKIAALQPTIGIGANPQVQGKEPELLVNVTGMQFAWIFNYPDSEITSGELHVPIGADVQLNLAASDVIHSLWIPQFRLKQDAIPGQSTQLRFVATKPGTYPIVCTELCGGYHGSMRSQVIVHTPEDFDNWLETNQIAQADNQKQVVALQPRELSKSEFLTPYVEAMGATNLRF
ncbi:MAG: hypothetical protein HC785_02380 [Calothrix sp. CSU_2_0]|nr:hypothetical protein [Calothrix sp. CSU_2_0]